MSFNFFRAGSTLLMTRIRAMCVAAMIGGSAAVSAQTPTVPCDEVFIQNYEYDDGGAVYRAFTPLSG
jgi:hypothetical protein